MSSRGALALLALGVASCAPPPPVSFALPSVAVKSDHYDEVFRRWTRHAHVTHDFDSALDAQVTLLAPEMRAAYIAKVEAMRPLTESARAKLEADQRDEGNRFVDFMVNAQTGRWDWNDFGSPRSLWTFLLVDDAGRTLSPSDRQPAPIKAETAQALFPEVTPFTRLWRIRFSRLPEGAPPISDAPPDAIGGPSTKWLSLRIAGPLGATLPRDRESDPAADPLRWESR